MKIIWYTIHAKPQQSEARRVLLFCMKNVNHLHKETLNWNEKVALRMTNFFGSMSCFYLFVFWALLPFIPFFSKYQVTILYISAGFIQLVALPLISVGQNLSQRHAQLQAEEDFEINKKSEHEITELHKKINRLLKKK